MADKINDGGQAFPFHDGKYGKMGMTLRDWFAGQALIGLTLEPVTAKTMSIEHMAAAAYRQADAMLKARDGNT